MNSLYFAQYLVNEDVLDPQEAKDILKVCEETVPGLAVVALAEVPETVVPVDDVDLFGIGDDVAPVVEEAQRVLCEHAVSLGEVDVGAVVHRLADGAAVAQAD